MHGSHNHKWFCTVISSVIVLSGILTARAEAVSLPPSQRLIDRALMIRQSEVVDGPLTRYGGSLHFSALMQRLLGQQLQARTQQWFSQWQLTGLNHFPLLPRRTDALESVWLWKQGQWDWEVAPFHLMAVVFRPDLISAQTPQGEGRLVYGMMDPITLDPVEFTVIFEFALPPTPPPAMAANWRQALIELAQLSDEQIYQSRLEQLVLHFSQLAQLQQIRSNDFYLDFTWEMREFKIIQGQIQQVPTAQNPDLSFWSQHNVQNDFLNWMDRSQSEIIAGTYVIPQRFLAPAAPVHDERFVWRFSADQSPLQETLRQKLSFHSCGGCHAGETQTVFTHIKPRRRGNISSLSDFLRQDLEQRAAQVLQPLPFWISNSTTTARVH